MRVWFALPQRDDEYETFAAHVLHYTLLILTVVALTFVFFASSPSQLIFIPVAVGIFLGCYALLHSGRLRLASVIFVGGLWIVITLAAFSINGIRNAAMTAYAIAIIFSAVLFSGRAVIVLTGLSILSAIILVVGETAGALPLRTTPLYGADRFFQLVALYSAAGILLFSASRVIRGSLQRIRKNEETLRERNQALEMEIGERKRTEENLRISEKKYRLLFENIPVMARVYGQDGEIILLNNAAAHALGGTPETLQGRNMRDVFSPVTAERGVSDQAKVLDSGIDIIAEYKAILPDDREIYYLRHIMPLPNASQVLVVSIDLTEKYLAEQHERELALAHEKNAFLTEFFSTFSHDLKTPLTVMNTTLYLLKRAETAQQREERITRMGEQISLMDKFIQDMLTIARLEHLPTLNFQEVDLNPLVEQVVDLLRPRIEGKQLKFQFSGQPGLPVIRGDQDQLQRMLTNLVENAVNYTPVGGHVSVKTYMGSGRVALDVGDSGIGIEPDDLPHIFERFYRTTNARSFERNGTGLGLAIVKKIVETHTATIDVRSQIGEGTTFFIEFPAGPLP